MDIGAILLLLALVVLVALFVGQPFIERRRIASLPDEARKLSSLLAERDRVINALQELDFDYVLGKIPADDYPQQRTTLLQHGADVLRKIDALEPQASAQDVESRIEAAIAARRADAAVPGAKPAAPSDDDLEELIASRRSARSEKSGGFCPKCGRPLLRSDRFCPRCGSAIK
jgi:hypothetical protein